MGRNRKAPTPEAYPAAFLTAIRSGAGIIMAHDLPWSLGSAAKRFRLCIALIRSRPDHHLHAAASKRWSVHVGPTALEVTVCDPKAGLPPSVGAALIARALST